MPIRLQPEGGDLFESGADVLVNAVNTAGVMGAGLAKQFRLRFPGMFEEYRRRCRSGLVQTGEIDLHVVEDPASGRRVVVANFPTKQHWRDPSRIEWIKSGLAALSQVAVDLDAGSIAVPPLGCGLGGLDWPAVQGLILEALTPVAEGDVDVLLYPPARR